MAKYPAAEVRASPPCQPWSGAGKGAGLMSKDGQSLLHTLDFVAASKPGNFFLENVRGLVRHTDWPEVHNRLERLGLFGPYQQRSAVRISSK